jgi:hypothetical protein
VIVQRFIVGTLVTIAAGSAACATSTADGCTTDADCKGSRVCVNSTCIDPSAQNDAGTPQTDAGSPNNDSGMINPPSCDPVGTTCATTAGCCQAGTGIGASGAICISNDNLCHAACATNAECTSGCCAPVEGQSLGVCAEASECAPACVQPGGACALSSQCCQTGGDIPYGAKCLTEDYTCHDICYTSSECTGGCCIELQGLSYGACGTPTGHVCL